MSSRWSIVVGVVAALALAPLAADAQARRVTVRGRAVLGDGTGAPGLPVTLAADDGGVVAETVTDAAGAFVVRDVAPGRYRLRAAADPLRAERDIDVGDAPVVEVDLRLALPSDAPLVVIGTYDPLDRATATVGGDALRALPSRIESRALPEALAGMPGWAAEDNGLLHVRGVDDGVLYVEDGVPVYDRIDATFGIPPSLAGVGTLSVTTGHTPAQFGMKSGAVVQVASPPAPDRWTGEIRSGAGSSELGSLAASGGGPVDGRLDLYGAIAAERSNRFLDPVHPDNLHNTGGVAGATLRARVAVGDGQVSVQGRSGRSRFDVPHGEAQDAAGQDQRQRIAQHGMGIAVQQVLGAAWITAGAYGRRVDAHLDPSAADVPLSAASARRHDRLGVLASWGLRLGRHALAVGGEAARLAVREDFRFAVTGGDDAGLSDAALAFTADRPFRFAGRVSRAQWSAFAQDRFLVGPLALDTGLRVDHTALLVAASQWSPRLGAVLDLPSGAAVRLSFNRFFQPPQAEHLLLASSEAARVLSPFAGDGEGGADVPPERQTAWEAGIEKRVRRMQLDVAAWRRSVENYADPNVFFGTTIVFPNAVARGTARGLDVRLSMPALHGWTASATYTLSKVDQEGPITGGLFLEDDLDEIGEGVRFTPDHDQRHVGAVVVTWVPPAGRWSASAQARYASGTPLEVGDLDDDELDELAGRPGADLIDLERGRVRPRLVLDLTASMRLKRTTWGGLTVGVSVLNAANGRYAYNFGNPFSGTHFGAPRQVRVDLTASVR
ncbi:MAG: TonB-dependent receptor [Vicinamibacterales bacterium]